MMVCFFQQVFTLCFCSQEAYFNTQQIALLVMFASFVHPGTQQKVNWTFSFLSDDASHSSVSIYSHYFCDCSLVDMSKQVASKLLFCLCLQDFVHHCTGVVLGEVRKCYQENGKNPFDLDTLHLWSDNCASQFKCANTFGWGTKFLKDHKLKCIVRLFS